MSVEKVKPTTAAVRAMSLIESTRKKIRLFIGTVINSLNTVRIEWKIAVKWKHVRSKLTTQKQMEGWRFRLCCRSWLFNIEFNENQLNKCTRKLKILRYIKINYKREQQAGFKSIMKLHEQRKIICNLRKMVFTK